MKISPFSIMMSVLCCNSLIIINYTLFRSKKFNVNIYTFLVIIMLCIVRPIFCFELPSAYVFPSIHILPFFTKITYCKPFSSSGITLGNILFGIWITGAIFYLFRLIMNNMHFYHSLNRDEVPADDPIVLTLGKITNRKVKIYFSTSINSPMITGFLHPEIYLPNIAMPEKNLYYILLHEWNHYIHKDLWIKLSVEILCCIYWWNPFLYFLRYDLDNILEIKNDFIMTKKMNDTDKTEYLETLLVFIKLFNKKSYQKGISNYLRLVYNRNSNIIERRFQLILAPNLQRKAQKLFSYISCFSACILFILSFIFVIQPRFEAPEEESGIIIYDIDSSTAYLLDNLDNSYSLFINDKFVDILTDIDIFPFSTLEVKGEHK